VNAVGLGIIHYSKDKVFETSFSRNRSNIAIAFYSTTPHFLVKDFCLEDWG